MTKSSKLVGTPCKLAFEMKDHVVAWGTIFDSDVEGDNVKMAVDVVVEYGDCVIPILTKKGIYKMSQEVGSHILWPRDLVITNNIKVMKFSLKDIHVAFCINPNCNIFCRWTMGNLLRI